MAALSVTRSSSLETRYGRNECQRFWLRRSAERTHDLRLFECRLSLMMQSHFAPEAEVRSPPLLPTCMRCSILHNGLSTAIRCGLIEGPQWAGSGHEGRVHWSECCVMQIASQRADCRPSLRLRKVAPIDNVELTQNVQNTVVVEVIQSRHPNSLVVGHTEVSVWVCSNQ